jgi:OOP family OmpA-OmpF porin
LQCIEEMSMVDDTPERSEDDIEPSESTDAARMLRDVLAADRGVDLVAIEAARQAAAEATPEPDPEPPKGGDPAGTKRKVGAGVATAVVVLAIGGYAMASPSDPSGSDAPDLLAAAPTTEASTAISQRPAPSTTEAPEVVDLPVPSTTSAPTTAVPATADPAPAAAQPERGAVYKDGQLILQGAVPTREVADAFIAKAAEVIGPDNVVDNYVVDPGAEIPTDGRVVVDDPVLFATGSTEVSPDFYGLLDLGVAVMSLNPQVVMIVEGHTDEVGSTEANQRLSEERARSVVAYITDKGIDPGKFEVIGKGETDPVAPNDTPEGRQQNRRIEVQLINLLTPTD